ncbi:MAG TPA: glycosyltransferase family 2 protein, partial [Nitrosomonas sp.]|nr:glycosyltransferase family 2 protein [Nitrosomonas sp.]
MTDIEIRAVIGILIVVHNRKEDLIRLLRSLDCQQYQVTEILIIDNGSTDDLSEVQNLTSVEYLKLEENTGFVSGMVRGIRYLLSKNRYRYIWILDSDIEVSPTALNRLVAAFEEHKNVGLAGSVVWNKYAREIVVEAGACVDLRSGVVTARFCNERQPMMDPIMDVDFVGSGSGSLIRADALHTFGLHDERYFFLWEDVDYGLCLKQNGLRSVVVADAAVFHPPFTEKRNPNIYAYYGVRNPLLTVAKYTNGLRLPLFLFGNLNRYLRIALLMLFSGRRSFAQLTFRAIFDYIRGLFGNAELMEIDQTAVPMVGADLSCEKRVVILGLGSISAIKSAIDGVRRVNDIRITLVIQSYRLALLPQSGADDLITYDDRYSNALRGYLRTGVAILRQGGCIINTDLQSVSPLCYFGWRTYDWDHAQRKFFHSR